MSKKESLRDIGRALDEERLAAESAGRERLEEVLFPNTPVVWSERGWDGMLERMAEIKASLDAQKAEGYEPFLLPQEQDDLEAIAHAIAEALKPIMAAFRDLVEHFVEWMSEFVASDVYAELVNLSMAVGEPESQVQTFDVVDQNGEVVSTHTVGPSPVAAGEHVALAVDVTAEEAMREAGLRPSGVDLLNMPLSTPLLDHRSPTDIAVERAIRRPFTEPFSIKSERR